MDDDGLFDDGVAADYDRIHSNGDSELERLTAQTLSHLVFDQTALEFAIGTGRIAVPLHELGVCVKGIELV